MGGRGSASGIGDETVKIGDELNIANWFSFDLPNYAMQPSFVTIIDESASGKAWKVDIETETVDGERDLQFIKYMPKSAGLTAKQIEKQDKIREKKFKQGEKKYKKMIEFAKKNNVKGVRVGLRKETILEKIKKAGLKYKY